MSELDELANFVAQHGPLTTAEIATRVHNSSDRIYHRLMRLERDGRVVSSVEMIATTRQRQRQRVWRGTMTSVDDPVK